MTMASSTSSAFVFPPSFIRQLLHSPFHLLQSIVCRYSEEAEKERLGSASRCTVLIRYLMRRFEEKFSGLIAGMRSESLVAGLPPEEKPKLCDSTCEKELENVGVPMVTTESGPQHKDILDSEGPNPPIGFQVAANYVAMVIKGLNEGIIGKKAGGKRLLYVTGTLAFPKGLSTASGRSRVATSSPVVFDVSLGYIRGLDDE